jgi:hypothetical protein
MLTWLSRVFLMAAVLFAGWGVCRMLSPAPPPSNPPLVVDWPAADLGELGFGPHEVVVRISNPSDRTRRVLGVMQGCRPNVCFGPKYHRPVAIQPGATVEFACELDITGSGPFVCPIVLYLEENGIREVEHKLRGIAVRAEGKE